MHALFGPVVLQVSDRKCTLFKEPTATRLTMAAKTAQVRVRRCGTPRWGRTAVSRFPDVCGRLERTVEPMSVARPMREENDKSSLSGCP